MVPNMLQNPSRVPKMALEQLQLQPNRRDNYGFLIMTPELRDARRIRLTGDGNRRMGKLHHCKGLCENLPHVGGRNIYFDKIGMYWCSRCEIVMRCSRCRCCGVIGRAKPRSRNRNTEKRIE